MTSCLHVSGLQGYLEESGEGARYAAAEGHLAYCAGCRATFERLAATHRRVNAWLAKLSPPPTPVAIDLADALVRVMRRAADSGVRGLNPWALGSPLILQGLIVGVLMLARVNEVAPPKVSNMTLIEPPPALKPAVVKPSQAGRGGQRVALSPPKGEPSRTALRAFVPPMASMDRTAMILNPSLPGPAESWSPAGVPGGNPLDSSSVGAGPGFFGGVGDGPGGVGAPIEVFTAGHGVTAPTLIARVDPEYSEEARKAKYGGSVTLTIIVSPEGRAEGIRVVKSLGMGLDEKAIDAVRQWRFRPGTNSGKPVPVRATVEVNFRLL